MSGNEPDLAAPAGALALIAQGIQKAHEELKDLGMIGEASAGRGFSELSLSGLELGHEGLAAGFATFCERWEWGVRGLMGRGNAFASGLGLAAGSYHEQEDYVKGTFKIAVNGLNGNPHLSEDEVTSKSWDRISTQNPWDGADWSAESFSQAHADVEQTWRDTGYDVQDAALDAARLDPAVREVLDDRMRESFEPSDEAIQQAQQPHWGQR
ncbi:hypothetical protein [Streptomyces liangshanensis]|uniref:hypothetical protein n=1 Tax=Streptomyces liangshanensis TaxID=2717324 RepID=UPI0036DF53B3